MVPLSCTLDTTICRGILLLITVHSCHLLLFYMSLKNVITLSFLCALLAIKVCVYVYYDILYSIASTFRGLLWSWRNWNGGRLSTDCMENGPTSESNTLVLGYNDLGLCDTSFITLPANPPLGRCFSALLMTTCIIISTSDTATLPVIRSKIFFPSSRRFWEHNHVLVLDRASRLLFQVATSFPGLWNNNHDGICAAGCPVAVNSRLVTW
jgi:hypothetical protein